MVGSITAIPENITVGRRPAPVPASLAGIMERGGNMVSAIRVKTWLEISILMLQIAIKILNDMEKDKK